MVRIHRLDNQAVRVALARRSSKEETLPQEVFLDSVKFTYAEKKNGPNVAKSKGASSSEATVDDDSDEKMSGSSGIGSNEENDCNVENVVSEANKLSDNVRKPIVHLPRIRSMPETPGSSRSNSPAQTKKRKWNEEELSDEITLNQVTHNVL